MPCSSRWRNFLTATGSWRFNGVRSRSESRSCASSPTPTPRLPSGRAISGHSKRRAPQRLRCRRRLPRKKAIPISLPGGASEFFERMAANTAKFGRTIRPQVALESVANDLVAAYTAGSVDRGMRLREQWNELRSGTKLGPNDGAAVRIGPALKWLAAAESKAEAAKQHHQTLSDLEKSLTSPTASSADLEHARQAAVEGDGTIPASLAEKVFLHAASSFSDGNGRRNWSLGLPRLWWSSYSSRLAGSSGWASRQTPAGRSSMRQTD